MATSGIVTLQRKTVAETASVKGSSGAGEDSKRPVDAGCGYIVTRVCAWMAQATLRVRYPTGAQWRK
jgi:hypothetical protein